MAVRPAASPLANTRVNGAWVFRPGHDVRRVAWMICERAWHGRGVRVFRWGCGTVAVVKVGSDADARLMQSHGVYVFATYCLDTTQRGPLMVDVIHDLHWAEAA